jgi:hypothetical protein
VLAADYDSLPIVGTGTRRLLVSGQRDNQIGNVTMSQIGGGLFSVARFDAADAFVGGGSTLVVTGLFSNNSTIQQVFSLGDQFATFSLGTGFTDLVSINFAESDFFQFEQEGFVLDNITSTPSAVGAVPEPSSWAMLIAGFGLVGAVARRRAAATA